MHVSALTFSSKHFLLLWSGPQYNGLSTLSNLGYITSEALKYVLQGHITIIIEVEVNHSLRIYGIRVINNAREGGDWVFLV